MKLRPLPLIVFLFSRATTTNSSPRLRPTLSATRKKTSLTGWLPPPQAQHLSPDASSASRRPCFTPRPFLTFIIQTPSSL